MPDIVTIQDAMSRVMADVREVKKTGHNESQHYDFRGIDAVMNAVGPALRTHEVVVLPHLDHVEYMPLTSSAGKVLMSARVIVTYRFVGPGGDALEATVAGEAFDSGDKATAKAMSVAFRTALLQALCLPTDDIDPDAQTYEMAGESTVAKRESVTSPAEPRDAQAAVSRRDVDHSAVASPTPSADLGGSADPVEAPAGDSKVMVANGEGAPTPEETPAGASTSNYLNKDDQGLLGQQWGTKGKAVIAYRARFGERINSVADITYEMRDLMEAANA